MKLRIYTDDEVKRLKSNIFIRSIKYKRELEYDPIFKLWTIMMRLDCPELTAREIFARAGIDVSILHRKLPQNRIREWISSYRKFGIKYFIPESEPYSTISNKKELLYIPDDMKKQLLEITLKRLRELADEEKF